MKITVVLLINVLLTINLIADKSDDFLSKIVVNQIFKDGDQFWSTELKFKDKTYSFEYGSEGRSWYNLGSFEILNSKINFNPLKCLGDTSPSAKKINCRDSFGAGFCYVKDTPNDVNYEKILRCETPNKKKLGWEADGFFFPIITEPVKAGTEKNFQGVPVLILGLKKARTIDVVKIREAPNLQSKTVIYRPDTVDEFFQSVPKNVKIILIARTLKMEKIKDWSNYWYLVNVGYNKNVWMFGEFIKEYD